MKRFQIALVMSLLGLLLVWQPAETAGGTNGLLGHMEVMANELAAANILTPAELKKWQATVKMLRQKVDTRILENGGSINTNRDKDLYDEIDSYNKPLFLQYQQFKAKQQNPDTD